MAGPRIQLFLRKNFRARLDRKLPPSILVLINEFSTNRRAQNHFERVNDTGHSVASTSALVA
jgi:hypothetical protein